MNSFTTTELAEPTENEESSLTGKIIGAAIDVHRALGPGLLEKALPIFYKDVMLDCGYRADIVVEHQVLVQIKSIVSIAPIHEAQLLSYLKMSDCKYGLLINFNVKLLKEGIRRFKA